MIYRIKGLAGLFALLFFIACNNEQEKTDSRQATGSSDTAKVTTQNVASLRIKVFNNDTAKNDKPIKGFGYDIYSNDALYIHQPSIPAVGGNNGFSTEAKAKKVAGFVVYKIEHNIMPPSVTPGELDSLGVLKKKN
ncbi:MAG: DUF4907 domain-containing protein [Chitinophagaceae bacterium]